MTFDSDWSSPLCAKFLSSASGLCTPPVAVASPDAYAKLRSAASGLWAAELPALDAKLRSAASGLCTEPADPVFPVVTAKLRSAASGVCTEPAEPVFAVVNAALRSAASGLMDTWLLEPSPA